MASSAICGRFVVLLALVAASRALTFDEEATNDVIAAAGSARESGEVAIVIKRPHSKSSRREELMRAMSSNDNAISLYYNSKNNKVSLESLNGSNLKSVSWGLGTDSHGVLVFVASSKRVKLFVGCKSLHWHDMPAKHDVLELFSQQKLKLYHDENTPVEVYGNDRAALDSIGCDIHKDSIKPPTLVSVDETDVEEVKDFIARDARWKREEEEEMQGDDYRTNFIDPNGVLPQPSQPTTQRGDIPSTDIESCDDEVIRQLKLLRQTIDILRQEMADQKGNIDSLRNQLRACCNKVPSPPPVERCSGSSCYPGY